MKNRIGFYKRPKTTITFNEQTKTIAEWSKETGLTTECIRGRLSYNWPPEKILTTPAKKKTFEGRGRKTRTIFLNHRGGIGPI